MPRETSSYFRLILVQKGLAFSIIGLFLACLTTSLASSASADEPSSTVPLKRVVLYTCGVGFFEHDGQVQDNAQVDLRFNVRDMNDVLMSLVAEDLSGGTVSTVSCASKTPIVQTLKTFSIDLADNPTLGQLLNQARGERVEVDAPNKIEGTIVGVHSHKKQVGDKEFIESEVLDLLSSDGLRSVAMENVSRIKLLNERLNSELQKALAVLATSHATEKKEVTLDFLGKEMRQVRIGYLEEMPLWRTSYRLVLGDKQPPFLQGWAIIENTTENDWKNIDLTLVSGQPLSFKMDLYEPQFVPRPEVQLPTFSSLRPQMYGEAMEKRPEVPMAAMNAMARAPMPMARRSFAAAAPASPPSAVPGWNLQQSVQTAARAGALGELFQYAIATPVSLSRQKAAMLPIVNTDVKGEKVAIYDETVQAKYPLNGFRLVNSTKLFLMQGPVTVYDGGAYAGDALIENIPPGEERILSYAVDLDVELASQAKSEPEKLLGVKIARGTMFITRKLTREQDYTIKNSGKKEQKVLVVQPIDYNWKLVEPTEPTEKTRDKYRFAVEAKPGEAAKLAVKEEQTLGQEALLTNADIGTIQIYIGAKEVSDKVKAALAEVVKRKQAVQEVSQSREQLERQLQTIVAEQDRIRKNMAAIDRSGDLYKRYVKMLGDQEDKIERLHSGIQEDRNKEAELNNALNKYLMGLDLP